MRVTKYLNGIKGLERINQAILILSLLLAFGTVQAQEESDATWEETVGFIEKYSNELVFYLDDDILMPSGANWNNDKEELDVEIDSAFIRFKLTFETDHDDIASIRKNGNEYLCKEGVKTQCVITIYFEGLTIIDSSNLSTDYPRLNFIDNRHVVIVETGTLYGCKVMYGSDVGRVNYEKTHYQSKAFLMWKSTANDIEIKQMNYRMANAFNHLSKLADKRRKEDLKKREAERKASGDKF